MNDDYIFAQVSKSLRGLAALSVENYSIFAITLHFSHPCRWQGNIVINVHTVNVPILMRQLTSDLARTRHGAKHSLHAHMYRLSSN